MPSRRKFLKNLAKASAGLCFVNCGFMPTAFASARQSNGSTKRRSVMVGGRPVRTIDIHAHCYVDLQDLTQGHPEALIPNGGPPTFDGPFLKPRKDAEARLRHMDEHGIDIQAVSLAPAYNYWADRDLATKIVSRQNEQIAALCAAHSDRFVGLGGLALQHPLGLCPGRGPDAGRGPDRMDPGHSRRGTTAGRHRPTSQPATLMARLDPKSPS